MIIIFLKNKIIVTFIYIKNELNINMYNVIPTAIPKNINKRISPLLKTNMKYNIEIPVKKQNNITSI